VHTFIVVARKPGKMIPAHVLELLRRPDLRELAFEPESHVCWSNSTGDVHFGGWQAATDVFEMGSHWRVDEHGLTAFSGRPFLLDRGWTAGDSWAAQLSRELRRRALPEGRESLRGVFSAVCLGSTGGGCVVSDALGLGLVYVAHADDFSVLSNRAALAARAVAEPGRSPRRDPVAVGWLVHTGYIIGDATGFEGVRTIPQGACAELDPELGLVVIEPPHPPWTFPDNETATDLDRLMQTVRDDIASALRAAVELPASQRRADITGGKDSRLILAALISEGLVDSVDFYTFGAPSLPDVIVGKDVAKRFGLSHQAQTPQPLTEEDFDQRLRIHVFQTSGMLGAWDMKSPIPVATSVHIAGTCGEILRTNFPGYRDITSADHMLRAFQAGMPFDTLGLLKPELRAYYDEEATSSLLAGPWDGNEPLDLIDVFYLKNRLRRWFGTDQEIDCWNRVFPLYSLVGVRAAFAIGPSRRRNDFIPFEVMRRCSAELTKVPLAKGRWDEELIRDLPDAEEFRAIHPPEVPPTSSDGRATPREWQAERLERNRDVLERVLGGDPQHPVFELIDRDAAVSAIDSIRELSANDRIQLYGAATAAIWLGEGEAEWRVSTSAA
jgi:hypothetical protein